MQFVVPSEPQELKADSVTSTSVTLQWMPPTYPNGVITKYSVHYDGIGIDPFGNVSDKMMNTIEGLSPDTQYVFEMKAYTRVGEGLPNFVAVKTRKLINSGTSLIIHALLYI